EAGRASRPRRRRAFRLPDTDMRDRRSVGAAAGQAAAAPGRPGRRRRCGMSGLTRNQEHVRAEQEPRGQWTAVLVACVLLGVEAVIVAESWRGLTGFAHLIGITGRAAWGVPVTLDGVSLVAALVALRAELAGEASGLYRAVLFAFTAASATANYWHGL